MNLTQATQMKPVAREQVAPPDPKIADEKKAGADRLPNLEPRSSKVTGSDIFGGAAPIAATQKVPPEAAGKDKDQAVKEEMMRRRKQMGSHLFAKDDDTAHAREKGKLLQS